MSSQKRVLAVHDISCIGKCSLTVALPVISAAGIETSVLPTSVLSTHTGGFDGYTFRDLGDDIEAVSEHWKSLGIHFDAIYTGFLGSAGQAEKISALIDRFSDSDTLVAVDPVMADNGKLYRCFDDDFPKYMKKLCEKATLILPNITEACLLTSSAYNDNPDEDYIKLLVNRLKKLTSADIVLTGISAGKDNIGAAYFGKTDEENGVYCSEKIKGMYHGTGDVFASAVVAALVKGIGLEKSVKIAVDFAERAIKRTHDAGTDPRFGVNFEEELFSFCTDIKAAVKDRI